ncbi:hypothetical protein [Palleronia caenipelagi]|nr:hypothetical protein [Palleronia caenipelagi]
MSPDRDSGKSSDYGHPWRHLPVLSFGCDCGDLGDGVTFVVASDLQIRRVWQLMRPNNGSSARSVTGQSQMAG